MKGSPCFLELVMFAVMVAIRVMISPILRTEGMCPVAHLINIVYTVFLGPGYAFACAFIIGILRITLVGIPPLVLTGAIFGVALSGVLCRLSGSKLIFAMIGKVISTGIIGTLVPYPTMTLLVDRQGIGWAFYIPSFLGGTLIGGSVTSVFLNALAKTGMLTSIQKQLGTKAYDKSRKSNIHNI